MLLVRLLLTDFINRVIYAWKILIQFKLPIWCSKKIGKRLSKEIPTYVEKVYPGGMFYSRETDIYSAQAFTACGPDPSHNLMDTGKTVDLTHLCIQINNTVVFPIIRTSNLQSNPKQKHVKVNRKYCVTSCFVSHGFGLRTFSVDQSDSVNN